MAYNWTAPEQVSLHAGPQDSERKPLAPVGAHPFTVMEAEMRSGKTSGLPYINLKLRVGEGQYDDVWSVVALPDDARQAKSNAFLEQSMYGFLDTIKVPRDKASAVTANVEGLVLKSGRAWLKKDSYTNPTTGETRDKRQPDWIKSALLALDDAEAEATHASF